MGMYLQESGIEYLPIADIDRLEFPLRGPGALPHGGGKGELEFAAFPFHFLSCTFPLLPLSKGQTRYFAAGFNGNPFY